MDLEEKKIRSQFLTVGQNFGIFLKLIECSCSIRVRILFCVSSLAIQCVHGDLFYYYTSTHNLSL